jgi:putative ABC transport system permease protein
MRRLLRQVSLPYLRASWGRTALVVCGIATGVSLIVAINVINATVVGNFRRTIELVAGPAALQVTLGGGETGFAESTIDVVRNDPEVAAAVPMVRGTISLAARPAEALQLFGVDLTAEEDLARYRVTTSTTRRQAAEAVVDPHSVFLTREIADQLGITTGDTVDLSTPEGVIGFKIRGILEPEGLATAFGGHLVVMDLAGAQVLLGKSDRIDQIDVILKPDATVERVQARLESSLKDELWVGRPQQRGSQYERVLQSVQAMLTGISTLCLIAGVYIIYNTTSTGAVQRALVMAELRILGAESGRLLALLLLEATVLGVLGTAIGMVYGLLLAWLLAGTLADTLGIIFQLRFPVDVLAIDANHLAVIAVVGVLAALFACSFAARRVASLDPLQVIRVGVGAVRRPTRTVVMASWWTLLVLVSALALWGEVHWKSTALGNLGASLWNAAAIVAAVPLVNWLANQLSQPLRRLFGAEGQLAAASIARSPTRAGVTAAAVALIIGAAITLTSLSTSFRQSLDEYVARLLAGDLVVSAVSTEGGWLETPLPEGLAQELTNVPGVRSVEVMRVIPGQFFRGHRIGILALSEGMIAESRQPALAEGDASTAPDEVRAGRGVYVSTTLADRFGLRLGETLELDTPTGILALPIVGVLPDYISDRGSVILVRRLLVERWHETMVSRLLLFLQPNVAVGDVQQRLVAQLGDRYRLKIQKLPELLAYHSSIIGRAFQFTDTIQLLIVIVTIAGVCDLLLSSIAERRRELALWRLIGAADRAVRRSITIESGTIGCIGAALGVVLGYVTAWMWVAINYRYLIGFHLQYHFATAASVWFVVLVLAVTTIVGYAASANATREPISTGIQAD